MSAPIFQAIVTKYLGPTNTRGSRIKASASAGSKTVEYDCALNPDDNHKVAAETLATSLGWAGQWFGGGMPQGNGNVFVCVNGKAAETLGFHSAFEVKAVQS